MVVCRTRLWMVYVPIQIQFLYAFVFSCRLVGDQFQSEKKISLQMYSKICSAQKNFDQRPSDLPHGEEALMASPSEGAGLVNCTDYEV